jgi:hypothetical protein
LQSQTGDYRESVEVGQAKAIGSLAQLVQSICLTSRGSGVRTPQLPRKIKVVASRDDFFFYIRFMDGLSSALSITSCILCIPGSGSSYGI